MTLSLSLPRSSTGTIPGIRPVLARISAGFGNGIRAMQYARMREAMSQMSEEQLAAINVTRADIPRHAHDCVYTDA